MPVQTNDRTLPTDIDRVALAFISIYHLLLLITLPLYLFSTTPDLVLIGCSAFLLIGSGLSITAGYHRLYSHRTYRVKKPVEWILLFFGTLSAQGSVLRWAHDHRLHHRHVDTEKDPYGTQKGFWHSHLLWMFKAAGALDDRYIKDLKTNEALVFQHKYYGSLVLLTNAFVVLVVGWITGDFAGAFVIAFLLRLFLTHHSTWFINSLAHMWGSKPYSSEHSAVNNFILALLTFGEGYHNYHHTFAGDYRNGIRWYQFDPTKMLIWTLSKVGLTSDLKRADALMIKKRLVQADRDLLIDHLKKVRGIDTSSFIASVEELSSKVSATINTVKHTYERYRSLDRKTYRDEARHLQEKYRKLKSDLSRDLRTWNRLCRLILKMDPAIQ